MKRFVCIAYALLAGTKGAEVLGGLGDDWRKGQCCLYVWSRVSWGKFGGVRYLIFGNRVELSWVGGGLKNWVARERTVIVLRFR
jgi:hypothetical protein